MMIVSRLASLWRHRSSYWKDVSWAASGTVLAQAINLLSLPVLTRLYTPSDFAALNIFTQAVASAAILLTLRYEYAIHLPRTVLGASAVIRLVMVLAALGTLILTPTVWLLFGAGGVWPAPLGADRWIAWVPATAALLSISTAIQFGAQRNLLYRRASIAEVMGRVLYFGVAAAGHLVHAGAAGLLAAVVASYVAKIAALTPIRDRRAAAPHSIRWRQQRKSLTLAAGRHRGLALSMVSSHLVMTLTGLAPSIFIAKIYGIDTLGQFALVVSTTFLPSALIGSAIGQVYNQRAAKRWIDGSSFEDLWRATSRRLAILGVPMYVGLAVLAPWLYPFVFGDQWQQAGYFASIMSLGAYMSYQTTPLDRSSLIVGVWWYLQIWHVGRLLGVGGVILAAWWGNWSVTLFIAVFTLQVSALYLVDFFCERHFARQRP